MFLEILCSQTPRFVKAALVNALSICLLCCAANAQSTLPINISLKDSPITYVHIRKAAISGDSLYLMPFEGSYIDRYSLVDRAFEHLDVGANGVVPLMRGVEDFMLDSNGNMHVLAFLMPKRESGIIQYKKGRGRYSCIYLSKPLYAYQLDMDSQGNYYLLGFDAKYGPLLPRGEGPKDMINLAHKFSPDGRHLASFLPIKAPASEQEFNGFLSSLVQRKSFMVTADNEVYYFQLLMASIDSKPWDSLGIIHRANEQSYSRTTIEQIRPGKSWLAGIHKYNDQIAYEWAETGAIMSKKITDGVGSDLWTIPKRGQILAIKGDTAVMVVPEIESKSISLSVIPMR